MKNSTNFSTQSTPFQRRNFAGKLGRTLGIPLLCLSLITGCWRPSLSDIPGLPADFTKLEDWRSLAADLGLPDLGSIADLPTIDSLPYFLDQPADTVRYNGPTERYLAINDRLPGSDWVLLSITDGVARFRNATGDIDKQLGDSLDFDGPWPQVPDLQYNLRLRIYRVTSDGVRAAGVHQLIVPAVRPAEAATNLQIGGFQLKFPFTDNVSKGELIAGTTLGYAGSADLGGSITGLPANESPYRKAGDSLHWLGMVRPDIAAEYNLRLLPLYTDGAAQFGGIVTIGLPTQ